MSRTSRFVAGVFLVASSVPVAAKPSSPVSGAAAALARDPMMSPFDAVRKIEIENEPCIFRALPAPAPPPKASWPPPVELQGIVMTASGSRQVIVNGELLNEGGTIKGIKIVRVGVDRVTFRKGKREFTKSIRE